MKEDYIDIYSFIQQHTQHNLHNNNKTITCLTVYDKSVWNEFQIIAKLLGTNVSQILWPIILKIVEIHNGKKNGLDQFIDPNFIPTPSITDDFETKILPYLRTLSDDKLHTVLTNLHRGSIYSQALRDTPIDERQNANFDYLTIWRKYRQ